MSVADDKPASDAQEADSDTEEGSRSRAQAVSELFREHNEILIRFLAAT